MLLDSWLGTERDRIRIIHPNHPGVMLIQHAYDGQEDIKAEVIPLATWLSFWVPVGDLLWEWGGEEENPSGKSVPSACVHSG